MKRGLLTPFKRAVGANVLRFAKYSLYVVKDPAECFFSSFKWHYRDNPRPEFTLHECVQFARAAGPHAGFDTGHVCAGQTATPLAFCVRLADDCRFSANLGATWAYARRLGPPLTRPLRVVHIEALNEPGWWTSFASTLGLAPFPPLQVRNKSGRNSSFCAPELAAERAELLDLYADEYRALPSLLETSGAPADAVYMQRLRRATTRCG